MHHQPSAVAGGPEYVTRMMLHATAGAAAAGIPPEAVSALMASSSSGDSGALEGPTCRRIIVPGLSGDAADFLSDMLLGYGAQSVMVQEHRPPGAPEQQIYEDGSGPTPLWDKCDVVAYFALEEDAGAVLQGAAEVLQDAGLLQQLPASQQQQQQAEGLLHFSAEEVVNEQWVEQIKASYVPIKISDSLYIVPEWSSPEDPAAINIILQPGVAFGTGEHPTTRLCLQRLQQLDLTGRTVMDYGAGSGVLALAALKLGASCAVGTDVDSLAVRAASRNAELNGVSERMKVLLCGPSLDDPEPLQQAGVALPSPEGFSLVVANILRGPLVELAPRLAGYAAPGAQLVLSGILAEQVPDVKEAYQEYFSGFDVTTEGSWACVTAVRTS